MIVNYYAYLRQVIGVSKVEFDLPQGGTLRQLIEEMVKRYPGLQREMCDQNGNLQSHIHIFVNGRDSTLLDGSLDSSWRQAIPSRFSLRLAVVRSIKTIG